MSKYMQFKHLCIRLSANAIAVYKTYAVKWLSLIVTDLFRKSQSTI